MAYFANGTEGMVFEEQCTRCIFGQKPCPIAWVQVNYNYDAVGNKVATNILGDLVKQDGTCTMFREFEDTLATEDWKDHKTGQQHLSLNEWHRRRNDEQRQAVI